MCAWQGQQYNQQYQQPWQQPQQGRSSWQDPRFTNQNAYTTNSPISHATFSPAQVYQSPTAPDTSNWGVKYHQAQQPGYSGDGRPPLPPRPASGLAHTSSPAPVENGPSWQAPTWNTPVQHTQTGYTQALGYGSGQQLPPGTFPTPQSFPNQGHLIISQFQSPPQSPAPPHPPPRPSAYQSQAQLDQSQWQHQQHYNQNVTYNQDSMNQTQLYDLGRTHQIQSPYQDQRPTINQRPLGSQAQTVQTDQRPPVSPEAAPILPWNGASQAHVSNQNSKSEPGASALGAGGPSDWEHFQASVADLEDEGTTVVQVQHGLGSLALSDGYAELPANFSPTASRREDSRLDSDQNVEPISSVPKVSEIPIREHSVSPEPSIEGLHRTGTIDGVIQAWNTTLGSRITPGGSRKSSVSSLDRWRRDDPGSTKSSPRHGLQHSSKRQDQASAPQHDAIVHVNQQQAVNSSSVPAEQQILAPPPLLTKTIDVDPYADLGPEYRASLARYATTLRKEEAAPDEERYRIFKAFVLKETRLRSILYGIEPDDADVSTHAQTRAGKTENGSGLGTTTSHQGPMASQFLPARTNASETPKPRDEFPSKLTVETTPAVHEDSYVVVERDSQSEYSPGGRPRISKHAVQRRSSHPASKPSPKATSSPSDYAPILVDELSYSPSNKGPALTQHSPPRPGTAPLAGRNTVLNEPIKFEPERPAYTPFRYAEGPRRGSEPLVITRPAYQAYSALRNQSVESGRLMAQSTINTKHLMRSDTLGSPTGGGAHREHEEAFLGLVRDKSKSSGSGKPEKPPMASIDEVAPLSDPVRPQNQVLDSLRRIIPTTMPIKRSAGPQIIEATRAIEKYRDVFTWIPEIVVAWDRGNRVVRKRQEDERQARQEESEKNIDALFNDHEIGYSDIGHLESEFKLAEATRKYEEDVQELESFTDQVFKPVTERLEEELSQLNAQYVRAVDVLELEADSGNQYIQGQGDRASRSEAMKIVLVLYNKMQIRYVKTAEAHHERERRRKKLELSVLCTNGDTAAMKRLEQDFSRAERQQSLCEAKEKDSRINKIMDTFDRAAMRGLGENQQFIDDVVTKLEIIDVRVKEKQDHVTELLREGLPDILKSTEELLDYIANDSKFLLTISNEIDNMLNNADYEVSVEEARVANATQESMKTLEEEKIKEDGRIQAEADIRMGSVATGPENALSLLRSLMRRSGDDPQHQDRVQKALEAAKLRNASKTPVG